MPPVEQGRRAPRTLSRHAAARPRRSLARAARAGARRSSRAGRRHPRACPARAGGIALSTRTSQPNDTPIARSPGRPSTPPSRIKLAMRCASRRLAGEASSRLNATNGSLAATSVAPAVGCIRGGPKSGRNSPALKRCAKPTTPPRRSSARVRPCARSPYKRTGHAEILAEAGGHNKRLSARSAPLTRVEVDEGHRRRARPHVGARRSPQRPGPAQLRRAQQLSAHRRVGHRTRALGAREREHRTVVISIGVNIEQARGSGGRERSANRVDRRLSATLGDVRHG